MHMMMIEDLKNIKKEKKKEKNIEVDCQKRGNNQIK